MRTYYSVSNATLATVVDKLNQLEKTFKNMKVEGFAYNGSSYVALVSYEV